MGKSREDPSCSASLGFHSTTNNCDQCKVRFHLHKIRLYQTVDTCDNLLLFLLKFVLMNIYSHGIDSGWYMLKADPLIFKYLKYLASEPNLTVHHGFLDINRAEAFLSGDTGNSKFRLLTGALYDQSTFILRAVCVTDIDRNSLFTNRENGILMKNSSSHVGKLTKFSVCDCLDRLRIVNDAWICYKKTGNVRPVLINICMNSFCNQRSGHIRTTSGKCLYRAICTCAVKSRNNRMLGFAEFFGKEFIGLLRFQITSFIKTDHRSCIHKIISKVCSHDLTIEELSSGCRILDSCLCTEIFIDFLELLLKRKAQSEALDDLIISRLDRINLLSDILPFRCCVITSIKHISHFDIIVKSLSRS